MQLSELQTAIPTICKSLSLSQSDNRFNEEINYFIQQIEHHPDLQFWDLFSVVSVFKFGFNNNLSWDKKQQLISVVGNPQGQPECFLHYRGKIRLASIKGIITRVDCELIYENDTYNYLGPDVQPEHRFTLKKGGRGDIVGGYSVSHLFDGSVLSFFFDMDDLDAAEERGINAGNADIWNSVYKKEMYRKSIISATHKRWKELELQNNTAAKEQQSSVSAPLMERRQV